jgi:hypothetical protein
MEPPPEACNAARTFPFAPQVWDQTLLAAQAYLGAMQAKLTQLCERVESHWKC